MSSSKQEKKKEKQNKKKKRKEKKEQMMVIVRMFTLTIITLTEEPKQMEPQTAAVFRHGLNDQRLAIAV